MSASASTPAAALSNVVIAGIKASPLLGKTSISPLSIIPTKSTVFNV